VTRLRSHRFTGCFSIFMKQRQCVIVALNAPS
jgi:hypothetical protein